MADEKPGKEEEVTPKGAVEVDEKDLDQAAGGLGLSGGRGSDDLPTESVSLNFSKIEVDYKPTGGPQVTPEKKI